MSNNNYKRGAAFERRVMVMCEKAGYTTFRTAGSHGMIDVIAIRRTKLFTNEFGDWYDDTEILLTQCKYGAKISKKDREALFAHNLGPCVHMVVAWGGPRKPVIFYNKHGEFKLD